jgi:hypothetical protein
VTEQEEIVKLTELQPHWVQPPQWSEQGPKFYIGVSFLCPHCVHTPCPTCGAQRGKRLAVSFWPPIDPESAMGRMFDYQPMPGAHQRVSGETFDTLTLAPSIGFDNPPHFHGRIENGEVTNQYPNMSSPRKSPLNRKF